MSQNKIIMLNNQDASANPSLGEVNPTNANPDVQNDQTTGLENLNINLDQSRATGEIYRPNQTDGAVPPEGVNADLLVRSPDALRREARLLTMMFDVHSVVPSPIEARLSAIKARLRQLISGENDDIQLMNLNEAQTEGLRLLTITDSRNENGQALSDEDASAITNRVNIVSERLVELRLATLRDEQLEESRPCFLTMSPDELDEELDRLLQEFQIKKAEDPLRFQKDLDDIRKRFFKVVKRQAELIRFPSDNTKDTLEEDQIQHHLFNSANLPRFLFRGSNSRSGGNESDSEPPSSDGGKSIHESEIHTTRMINEAGRIVPHAHFADPTMLNHPRRQTFESLLNAADNHTSARRFNTPFTSWSCDFETALYFAIGHYPSLGELRMLQESGERTDWVFHKPWLPADITVIDTWTIPDRHLRVFHQPDLLLDPHADMIPSEFLIYGALDRADGVDLRGVSIQELNINLRCPTWPICLSRVQLPHQPNLQDISEAWTIARAFFMQDWSLNEGGEAKASNASDDIGLAVLAGELARQQWAGSPPRPDAHELEAQVQIQWPRAWLRRIRRLLARVSPDLEPLESSVSDIELANADTPEEGFPQFQLMQQLLLSWVRHESADVNSDDDDDDSHGSDAIAPLRHDCANPTLRNTLNELERTAFWGQMVQRDREGNVPTPFPSGNSPGRNDSSVSTDVKPTTDEPTDQVAIIEELAAEELVEEEAVEEDPVQQEPLQEDRLEDEAHNDADVDNAHVEDVPTADTATEEMPTEANNPKNETSRLEQQPAGRPQPDASAQGAFPAQMEIPAQFPPQEQVSLREGGREHWEVKEVPFTLFRFLVFVITCLLTALYFTLVMAVY